MSETGPNGAQRWWWLLAFLLIALGSGCSAYLLARHFAAAGGGSGIFDICKAVFGGDCDAAIRGPLAVQLGIPLAGWGLIQFAVVSVSLLLALVLGDTFRTEGTLTALALCIVATAVGAVLTGMMVAGAAAFCPLCVIVHAINLLLVPVIVLASGRSPRQLLRSLRSAVSYLAGSDVVDPTLARWKITGLVTLGLVAIVGYQWLVIQTDRRTAETDGPVTLEQLVAEFESSPVRDLRPVAGDRRVGPQDARLQLVLFSDFQCPACQRFAQLVAHAREHHPEVAVIFKHFPLGKACNPGVGFDLHPLSCAAAIAAEAANRQGRFWEFHNALFASKHELDADVLRQLAEGIGLDMAQFEADLADPAIKAKVEADVALGNTLKIGGTPTAFLNGRVLSTRAMAVLDELIEHQLGR